MKEQTRTAWAIHTQSPEGHGFLGIFYLVSWNQNIPIQCDGNRTALFRTRRQAREALRLVKEGYGFKRARVYRVQVTIAGVPA